jgi:hypothetical protein
MLPRERVYKALNYEKPDIVPLEYHPSPRGFYEHGQKMKELFSRYPGDFGELDTEPVALTNANCIDKNGEYHEIIEDEWGTVWQHRIFLLKGQPVKWPLDNINDIHKYKLPSQHVPKIGSREFSELKSKIVCHKIKYFFKEGWVGIFEKLIALRKYEDVLVDIAMDTPEINKLADMLVDYHAETVRNLLEAGVDAIQFGDDYGTQKGLVMSPELWRKFFKPRLAKLMDPVKYAGKKVLFHSCGYIEDILDDLKEIGVDSIWTQLSVYDMKRFAEHCRDIKLASAIHIDRAHVMTLGDPDIVKDAVDEAYEAFRPDLGGSWFYVEVDNNFPFENIEALVTSINKYRHT